MAIWWIEPLAGVVAGGYTLTAGAIALYSLSQLHLLTVAWRREDPPVPEAPPDAPMVTVQLPIYNERTVVEALLDSVAGLDWPRDRFEIQLLDDSTDDTVELAAQKVAALREAGVDVHHIRRPNREGYKAGALAHGLETAKGDLVAILDADFRPLPCFLKRTVGALEAHPEWGLLQARWGHINREASPYTAAQAFHLDAHFTIEQAARSQKPLLMGFNGTAGVWRRQAIDDAGGWSSDTLTEDLDLAFRAQLAGWTLGYSDAIEVPAELPELVPAVRSQQHRWMKGGAQVSRKLLPTLWASDQPLVTRLQGTAHLVGGAVFLCVLGLCLITPMLSPLRAHVPWFDLAVAPGAVALQLAFLILILFYGTMCVRREPSVGAAARRFVGTFPMFLALSAGLSLHNSRAVWEGWFGRPSEFVRTPKRGDGSLVAYASRTVGFVRWAELAIALWLAVGIVWTVMYAQWILIPFLLMQAAGFFAIALAPRT